MRARPESTPRGRLAEAGFTLVELTIVVVISTIALVAIYQTLITQERTYRYQTAAIDAQGTSRMALQVIASELREISASAGATADQGGTDLLMASPDSLRVRAFRKVGVVCSLLGAAAGSVDVWVPGAAFVDGDQVLFYQAGETTTSDDDGWGEVTLSGVGSATDPACATSWATYPVQSLQGISVADLGDVEPGSLVRSYVTINYGNYTHDGMNVLGRITGTEFEPLVGPILPVSQGGLRFRYFNTAGTEITSLGTDAQRSAVARVMITVRSIGRGGNPSGGDWIDSVSTNVYLRGN